MILSAFDRQPRFLEVRVDGTVLGPRQAVRVAPFALFSLRTQNETPWDTATGGNFIRYSAGRVGIGFSANPRAGRESGGTGIGGIWGESDSSTGVVGRSRGVQARGVLGQAMPESTSGTGVYGWASADTGTTYAVRGDVLSPAGYAAYFTGATGSRNYFQRRVGIGTLNPAAMLEVAGGGNLIQATHSNGHPMAMSASLVTPMRGVMIAAAGTALLPGPGWGIAAAMPASWPRPAVRMARWLGALRAMSPLPARVRHYLGR